MDLLDFTRIRLDKREEKIEVVDLQSIAKLSISGVKPYAIQKNISIKLESEPGIEFKADPNDMEIVFNNLLSNAVKYNRNEGKVTVGINTTESNVVISVEDTGIGMKEEEVAQLFKEFFRIKNEKTKNIHGSGLGLSIVRKITDIYHGKIEVESAPDKGSIFTVILPKD
jgi:signal transduction histidine kinase